MVSLATETDRTLFFDFLPLDLGTVRGFKTRFHLYTVPGQVFYEASRKLILKGADGVAFVADSQEERLDANFETMENLQEHLKEHNLNFATIPYVLQLNKRDLPNALSVPELTKQLQKKGEPVLEGVAIQGLGVFETLKELAKLVLAELQTPSCLGLCPFKLRRCKPASGSRRTQACEPGPQRHQGRRRERRDPQFLAETVHSRLSVNSVR